MGLDKPDEAKESLLLFYSYAHTDELLRIELEKHLSFLQRQGTITGWHDRKITAGNYWAKDIDTYLDSASIILLLVSPDFLASDYCYSVEMQRALERHNANEAKVIPVVIRPCDWRYTPFAQLQCLPRDGKPITKWQNQDEAFLDVVQGIRRVVNEIQASSSLASQRKAPLKDEHSIEIPLNRDYWQEGGALGERVGSLARKKLWGQAEETARNIMDSQQRSLVLHKLVGAMIQSEEWNRAEAVAFSIQDTQYKRKALFELANRLIEIQQWDRAKAITYTIEYPADRAQLLGLLSRAIEDDEKLGYQAQILAYDSDRAITSAIPLSPPEYYPLAPSQSTQSSSRKTGCLLSEAALLVIAVILLLLLLVKKLPGTISFLLWSVIGVISIYILIRIISLIRNR